MSPKLASSDPRSAPDEGLYRIRHSLAHVLGQAVQRLYPGVRLGFGPPVNDGFYYDFLLPDGVRLSDADLPAVRAAMLEILGEAQVFKAESLEPEAAFERLADEPLKLEYARELVDGGEKRLGFWRNGPFVDLCRGPHVERTDELPADGFRLHSVAGAYWRGDEKRPMLTRVYGWAYRSAEELERRAAEVASARERDHRKLGQELGIFAFDEYVGKGLPLWLPAGTAIRRELEQLAFEMETQGGYLQVSTPPLARAELFETSGHLPLYKDIMFPPLVLGDEGAEHRETLYLRPMNCPHHHRVFAARKRSYRDLPLRLAEYAQDFRYERAGTLQGLARVRAMTMNDAHLYVTPEQLQDELGAVLDLHRRYYELFKFDDYFLRLSLWDPDDPAREGKYVDDPEAWEWSQGVMRQVLEDRGLDYVEGPGEAAFYGPKIDVQFRSALEKEYTVSTLQLDFAQPGRFGLVYTDRDGEEKTPFCIHRAPLSTHERFVAFLIEHYGGAFPTWLAPEQVRILPIADRHGDAARRLQQELRRRLVRVEVDDRDASLSRRVRHGIKDKVPVMAVLGDREVAEGKVAIRRYGVKRQEILDEPVFLDQLMEEIRERR